MRRTYGSGLLTLALCVVVAAAILPDLLTAETIPGRLTDGMSITVNPGPGGDSSVISLRMPGTVRADTIKIVLNGKYVAARFTKVDCERALCMEATLASSDGLQAGKNVLYAVGKSESSTLVSSRQRFDGGSTAYSNVKPSAIRTVNSLAAPHAAAIANLLASESSFLPTSVSFNTQASVGWVGYYDTTHPWFSIGSQGYPSQAPTGCSSTSNYLVVVLDRQTLVEKTSAPEGSPQCFTTAAPLAAYLKTLSSRDLVVAGTNYSHNADAGLDTSAIGGTNWGSGVSATSYPRGYMVIGAGGAAPGSAYESYYTDQSNSPTLPTFAYGMLQENENGDYSFWSSDAVEYIVSPNDPGYNSSMIRVGVPPRYQQNPYQYNVFTSPAPAGAGGYWLVVMDRTTTLPKTACPTAAVAGHAANEALYAGCGTFYPTGSADPGTATQAYLSLTTDLNAVSSWQLAFLTTVGTPANGNPFQVAGTNAGGNNPYFNNFASALERLYGTPHSTLSLGTAGSAYTLISSPGIGDSLSGATVLSSTTSAQQLQTGYVHGLLSRNINGLYQPSHTSQESQATAAAGGGSDFTIGLVTSQQPVGWPEQSPTVLMPGADSIAGQQAAYRFISYSLLTLRYVKGLQGPHMDDIHYFFTGSSNTFINYHTYDPADLPWPAPGSASGREVLLCDSVETNPANSADPICVSSVFGSDNLIQFSLADFIAVQQQLSREVINLTNVLLFMVNGSTNEKDVIASGNANLGLALVGAAATVKGSTLAPDPKTKVSISVSNILNLVGSGLNLAATIGTDGIIPPDVEEKLSKASSIIGDIFAVAGSATSGLSSTVNQSVLPSPNYTFTTTIGELAQADLQGQLGIGFDIALDTIVGDSGKLSAIGPLITDSSNLGFYSPNQVAQNATIKQMNQAAQRSFYLSLLPAYYSVQYWPSVYGAASGHNFPDMGYNPERTTCNAFYLWSPAPPPYVSTWYPSYYGSGQPFISDPVGGGPVINIDYYVIGGEVEDKSSSSARIPFLDPTLSASLFELGGLNIPFDPFISRTEPLAGKFVDMSQSDPTGFPNNQICSFNDFNNRSAVGATPPIGPTAAVTTTTYTGPASAVLGETVTLLAKAATSSAAITSGSVLFKDGTVALGTAALDATGVASLPVNGLALGAHSLVAYFLASSSYSASASAASALTIYANAPDLTLSVSANRLQVTYGTTSPAVTLQVASQSGLAGTITFSCSGLPVGMTCNFTPATAALASGATTTTSVVIASTAAAGAGLPLSKGLSGVVLLSLSLLCLGRILLGARGLPTFACLLVLAGTSIGCMLGCGGGSSTRPLQESGIKTILVNASTGPVTKNIPIVLNIQ